MTLMLSLSEAGSAVWTSSLAPHEHQDNFTKISEYIMLRIHPVLKLSYPSYDAIYHSHSISLDGSPYSLAKI